jgi:hypothetical protein
VADAPGSPVVTATFTSTPREVLASYRASHPLAYGFRCIAAATLMLTGFVRGDLTGVLLGAAVYLVGEISVRRQLQPQLQSAQRAVTVTATEDEYLVSGAGPDRARRWSDFRAARRTRRFWVLRASRVAALAVPVRAFDAEQSAAFEALLRRHGLL